MQTARHKYTDLRSLGLRVEMPGVTSHLLGWGVFEPKWWRNFKHTHSYFEVCFAYAGSGRYYADGEYLDIKENDLFVARPDVLHEIITADGSELGIYFWSFTLTLQQSDEGRQNELVDLFDAFSKSKSNISNRPETLSFLQAFTHELTSFPAGYPYDLQAIGQKLLLDTARAFSNVGAIQPPAPLLQDGQTALVGEIVRFLRDNFNRPLLLRNVAAQFHLSERHVNRVFKQATGESIMSYLKNLRIERAKELLLIEKMKIGEVAYAIGLEDVRYFSTLFRQHTGMSPTQFRINNGTSFES
ncbi:MAG: AraC family transcriptional regulator [Chloroflexota bacterium]